MPFLIFAYEQYEACGGMFDLFGSCQSYDEAINYILDKSHDIHCYQILDTSTLELWIYSPEPDRAPQTPVHEKNDRKLYTSEFYNRYWKIRYKEDVPFHIKTSEV